MRPLPKHETKRKIVRLLGIFAALLIVLASIDLFWRNQGITWGSNIGLASFVTLIYAINEFYYLLPHRKSKKPIK